MEITEENSFKDSVTSHVCLVLNAQLTPRSVIHAAIATAIAATSMVIARDVILDTN